MVLLIGACWHGN